MTAEVNGISVIIPAFRAEGTIGRALESVAAQTVPVDQVVVVDDGSDDRTTEIVETFSDRLPITLIRQENMGAGAARNRAIAASTQPLLAFLDADDEWLPEHIERSVELIGRDGHVLVGHNEWIVSGGAEVLNDCASRFHMGLDPYVTLYRKGFLSTCTIVARRDAVLDAGGFDESLANAQDFDLWLSILRNPKNSFTVSDAVAARYHVVSGSIMSHVDRRVQCCRIVARRYAPALAGRPGGAKFNHVYRLGVIHGEAMVAHFRNRDWGRLAKVILTLPVSLATDVFSGTGNGKIDNNHAVVERPVIRLFLWAWVVLVAVAYVYQFRDLFPVIVEVLQGYIAN